VVKTNTHVPWKNCVSIFVKPSPRFLWRLLWICCSRGRSERYAYGKQLMCLSSSWWAHFLVSWLYLLLQLWVSTFPRFVAIGFCATLRRHISSFRGYRILFSIRNPYINHFTNLKQRICFSNSGSAHFHVS